MKKIFSKEVIIAIVTTVSLVVLYLGINHLKGINVFQPTNYYYVSLSNVSELQKSSSVLVDGFKVGIVNEIHFDFESTKQIIVQISLDKSLKLQKGSYAELKSNFTSGAYLDLKLNKYLDSYCGIGDTIQGVVSPGILDQITSDMVPKIEQLLPRLDSILMGINVLVNNPALNQALNHIETTTVYLQQSSIQLKNLLSNDIPVITGNLNTISSDFTSVGNNLKGIDFQKTMASLDSVANNLETMSKQLNNPSNSLGLLLNDKSLYLQLDSTARNASVLLQDLKENPKRYVHFSLF